MKRIALAITTLMLLVTLSALAPAAAEDEPAASIGDFVRFGLHDELTDQQVSATQDGLLVEAPTLATKLKVDKSYLDGELEAWGAHVAFTHDAADRIVVPGADTEFVAFEPSEAPLFSYGSPDSIELTERPMWISYSQDGDAVTLELDDGDTQGQEVYLSKSWLWSLGIHRPVATHEGGTEVTVRQADDHEGFYLDMPHFSFVVLTPAEIDVKGRQNGAVFPHVGEVRWDQQAEVLEIDVPPQVSEYELLVEKDWFEVNMPYQALHGLEWVVESLGQASYLGVHFSPPDLPASVQFTNFSPTGNPQFTYGSAENIVLYAYNATLAAERNPAHISFRTEANRIFLNVTDGSDPRSVFINYTFMDANIDRVQHVSATNLDTGESLHVLERFDGMGAIIFGISGEIEIRGDSKFNRIERRDLTGIARFNITAEQVDTLVPLFADYLVHGGRVVVIDIPWGADPFSLGWSIQSAAVLNDGVPGAVAHQNDSRPIGAGPDGPRRGTWFDTNGLQKNDTLALALYSGFEGSGSIHSIPFDAVSSDPDDFRFRWEQDINPFNCEMEVWASDDSDASEQSTVAWTQSAVRYAGLAYDFNREFANSCDVENYQTHRFTLAATVRGPNWKVGTSAHTTQNGLVIEGSGTQGIGEMRSTLIKNPRIVQTRLFSEGSVPTFVHSSIGLSSENRNIQCEQTNGQVRFYKAIEIGIDLLTNIRGASLVIPEQKCDEVITKETDTVYDVVAAGGRKKGESGEDDEKSYYGFDSTWTIENPSGVNQVEGYTHVRGAADITEYYSMCDEFNTNCAHWGPEEYTFMMDWKDLWFKWSRCATC